MRVLLLAPKERIDPPVFAAAQLLAHHAHEVLCVTYGGSGASRQEVLEPRLRVARVSRTATAALGRLPQRALRLGRYSRVAHSAARQFLPDLVIASSFEVLPLAAAIAGRGTTLGYYALEYIPKPTIAAIISGWGVFTLLERYVVRRADIVISVERSRALLQEREWGRKVDHVVLNAPIYDAAHDFEARAAISTADKLRCVFAGQISHRNCLAEVLTALEHNPDVSLDLFGPVAPSFSRRFSELLQSSPAARCSRVRYCGIKPYLELKKTLTSYDVGLNLYDNSTTNSALAAPSKIAEYMRAGLATISTDQPTPSEMLRCSRSGYSVAAGSLSGLGEIFRTLVTSRELVRRLRLNALNAFQTVYAYDHQFLPVLRHLEALANRKRKRLD